MAATQSTRRVTLDNGLTVIVRESHRVPVATFWIWYRVGSRNEPLGRTGISHWVEHMLFKGTPDYQPGEIFRTINKFGGTLNGFTSLDYTAYFETVPNTQLELAVSIEADRMHNAIFDPEEFEKERTVILSEREGNENSPGFHLREEMMAAAFRAHPYGQSLIGFESDLKSMTRDELYDHYRTFYTPRNSTAVIVGDVDTDEAIDIVSRHFGVIDAGPDVPEVRTTEPEQLAERRIVLRRPAPARQMSLAWHGPNAANPDAPAMEVLDTILSGGKGIGLGSGGGMGRSSRLYRSLVSSGLCSGAGSGFSLSIDPNLFSVSATLLPETDGDEVESVIFDQVRQLREDLMPQIELDRAIKQIRAQFAYATESVTQQGYWLGSMATVAPDLDPDDFLEQVASVTAEDVQRVANTYLREGRYTLGWLIPEDHAGDTASEVQPEVAAMMNQPAFYTDGHPEEAVAGAPRTKLDITERSLSNGTRMVSNYDPTSEAAVVELRIPAGSALDGETPGLARLTGSMLTRGASTFTFEQFNEELDSLGAAIGVSTSREYVDVSIQCLREDAGRLIQLMADVVMTPTFPEDELERVRAQSMNALRRTLDDTRSEASHKLRTMLYPTDHPLYHRAIGTEETLAAITREQLIDYHRRAYTANGAIFGVAGGLETDIAAELIEDAFRDWNPVDEPARMTIDPVDAPAERQRATGSIAGKSQSDIAIGLPVIERSHPDYEALRMGNLILGRLGLMGRLGANVRDTLGLAYYAFSNLSAGSTYGRWTSQAGVNPENVDTAVDAILHEVQRLRDELVDPEEIADAKSFMVSSLPIGLESSGAIVATMLQIAFYDLGLDYVERLPERVNAVTAEAIREAAQRHLDPDRMAIAVVGP
ncbi:MAG: insulinase family protein [Sphaerobacteraceae bacterium]|nr:MAG: insulinase family protein [Sphaerobacteraceae bacterium]